MVENARAEREQALHGIGNLTLVSGKLNPVAVQLRLGGRRGMGFAGNGLLSTNMPGCSSTVVSSVLIHRLGMRAPSAAVAGVVRGRASDLAGRRGLAAVRVK